MLTVLVLGLLLGVAAFSVVELSRVTWPTKRWWLEGRRPWACNHCMSFWTSLSWSAAYFFGPGRGFFHREGAAPLAVPLAFTSCLFLLHLVELLETARDRASGPPTFLPEADELGPPTRRL